MDNIKLDPSGYLKITDYSLAGSRDNREIHPAMFKDGEGSLYNRNAHFLAPEVSS